MTMFSEWSKLLIIPKYESVGKEKRAYCWIGSISMNIDKWSFEFQSANNSKIRNVRGLGTFCAFDMPDAATRDKFLEIAGNNGI